MCKSRRKSIALLKMTLLYKQSSQLRGSCAFFLNLLDVHGINIRHTVNMVNFVTYVIRYVLLSSSLNGFAVNMFQGNNANM